MAAPNTQRLVQTKRHHTYQGGGSRGKHGNSNGHKTRGPNDKLIIQLLCVKLTHRAGQKNG
eukprot:7425057-Prorocentrum_lima.AAC.1